MHAGDGGARSGEIAARQLLEAIIALFLSLDANRFDVRTLQGNIAGRRLLIADLEARLPYVASMGFEVADGPGCGRNKRSTA